MRKLHIYRLLCIVAIKNLVQVVNEVAICYHVPYTPFHPDECLYRAELIPKAQRSGLGTCQF